MTTLLKLLSGIALSSFIPPSAQSQDIIRGDVLVCSSAIEAKDYVATGQAKVQTAGASETDAKSCLAAKIAFVPGKQIERMEQTDTTYVLTEILIVALHTEYGYLRMHPRLAYALLKIADERI